VVPAALAERLLSVPPAAQRAVQLAYQHCGLLPRPASGRHLMDRLDHAPDAFLSAEFASARLFALLELGNVMLRITQTEESCEDGLS
jgi:hypothetical protein